MKKQLYFEKIKNQSLKEEIKEEIKLVWTNSSTGLEGNTISLGDTEILLKEGITIQGKTMREHNEIIGHAKAIDVLYDIIKNNDLTSENLFELHKYVMLNPPIDCFKPIGKYKVEDNYTRTRNEDGTMQVITYPSYTKTNLLMGKWFSLFNKIKDLDLIYQYSIIHCAFTKIHPFADGNGRLARLVANIPILKNGLPPITIAKENREKYINCLEKIILDDNLELNGMDSFIDFISKEWKTSKKIFKQVYDIELENRNK